MKIFYHGMPFLCGAQMLERHLNGKLSPGGMENTKMKRAVSGAG